jgi:thiosulfate reductase cytochrome b subunit
MKTVYQKEFHHPFLVRASHWINVIALGAMVASGFGIYNASPVFSFEFPEWMTLGGWLGGSRMFHFAAMWLFFANGIVYVAFNLISKHGRQTTLFRGEDIKGILLMMKYYLRLRKEHAPQKKYNALQKAAYTVVPLLGLGSILTGMSIYWPVQMSGLTWCFGGYDTARVWHFLFTAAFVLFTFGHLFMVAIAGWQNFLSIFTGYKKTKIVGEQARS